MPEKVELVLTLSKYVKMRNILARGTSDAHELFIPVRYFQKEV